MTTQLIKEVVRVPMRDGVELSVAVYRPQGSDRHPALIAASPYQHEYNVLPAHPLFPWRETGPIEWYVGKGYAYVHMDVRGSGQSDGEFGYFDATEQQDYAEVIEWIARQDWSNGRVGGIGQSYYAVAQWHMAVHAPPALKCVAPYDGAVDLYRDQVYHGGIYCEFRAAWFHMLRSNTFLRAANGGGGQMIERDLVREMMEHQTYDDWWKERSPVERLSEVTVPVLSIGVWGKVGLHLRGNILGYELVQGPKRLVVLGASNVEEAVLQFDKVEFHERHLLPFYDHYLKGEGDSPVERQPVTLFIRGRDELREEAAWPLERAKYTAYYLSGKPSGSVRSINDGSLSAEPPGGEEPPASAYSYPHPDWKVGVVCEGPFGPDFTKGVLTFTSDPLPEDTEVTGPIVLSLFASSDQPDTDFFVKLSDQWPGDAAELEEGRQPRFANVTKGWLKASHRRIGEAFSSERRPVPANASPEPLEPGKVYEFQIEVHPTSYVFPEGHRIRLEIVNGDSRMTDAIFTHQYLPYKQGSDTIHHSAEYPSKLLVPVVPG